MPTVFLTFGDIRRAVEELADELTGPARDKALLILGLLALYQEQSALRQADD